MQICSKTDDQQLDPVGQEIEILQSKILDSELKWFTFWPS